MKGLKVERESRESRVVTVVRRKEIEKIYIYIFFNQR